MINDHHRVSPEINLPSLIGFRAAWQIDFFPPILALVYSAAWTFISILLISC